jgi:hypothetical protein
VFFNALMENLYPALNKLREEGFGVFKDKIENVLYK